VIPTLKVWAKCTGYYYGSFGHYYSSVLIPFTKYPSALRLVTVVYLGSHLVTPSSLRIIHEILVWQHPCLFIQYRYSCTYSQPSLHPSSSRRRITSPNWTMLYLELEHESAIT
jgi:hypothetical protein